MNEEIDWSKLSLQSLQIAQPPKPNWKVSFDGSTDTCIQFYIKNPPNRFQRWMIKKILGIRLEPVK